MNTFELRLLSRERDVQMPGLVSFVGEDASGSFGLLAGHEAQVTVLSHGLARVRRADGARCFIGLPGGVLSFADDCLVISTRRFVFGEDARAVGEALAQEVLAQERAMAETRSQLRHLETTLLRRLAQWDPR